MLGSNIVIGDGTIICCADEIHIGDDTMMPPNATLPIVITYTSGRANERTAYTYQENKYRKELLDCGRM